MLRNLILAATIALAATPAAAITMNTGYELRAYCGDALGAGLIHRGLCHGQVVRDFRFYAGRREICPPRDVSESTLLSTVQDYMRSRPDTLHLTADRVIFYALHLAYPCRY